MSVKTRRKWPFFLAAIAVLVIVIGGLLFLRAHSEMAPASSKTPAAASVPAATPESASDAPPANYTSSLSPSANASAIEDVPGAITPEIAKLHVTGIPQDVDIASYRLKIDGLVSTPLSLTYRQIMDYPIVTESILLNCPMVFWDDATWTGVPMDDLLSAAGVNQEATTVTFYALDGYSKKLDLSEVLHGEAFLATRVNGENLPRDHGFPVRLVVKGEDGSKWVKWIERILVS
jgi:DMSO/TMAO reductase YedYZ molybdopterin-dependent catalytic subunit